MALHRARDTHACCRSSPRKRGQTERISVVSSPLPTPAQFWSVLDVYQTSVTLSSLNS